MNQQHLENENQEPLRSQRMTEDEVRAVIGLWQQEKTDSAGLTTSPAVPDVAEGLDIGTENVQRLLAQIRAQREEEEHLLTQEQWQFELEQIRLAEEERKLAEIQRQRAELRREHSDRLRREPPDRLRRRLTQRPPLEDAEFSVGPQQYGYTPSSRSIMTVLAIMIIILTILSVLIGSQ